MLWRGERSSGAVSAARAASRASLARSSRASRAAARGHVGSSPPEARLSSSVSQPRLAAGGRRAERGGLGARAAAARSCRRSLRGGGAARRRMARRRFRCAPRPPAARRLLARRPPHRLDRVETAAVTGDDAVELRQRLDLVDDDAAHLRGALGGLLRQFEHAAAQFGAGGFQLLLHFGGHLLHALQVSAKRSLASRNMAWSRRPCARRCRAWFRRYGGARPPPARAHARTARRWRGCPRRSTPTPRGRRRARGRRPPRATRRAGRRSA